MQNTDHDDAARDRRKGRADTRPDDVHVLEHPPKTRGNGLVALGLDLTDHRLLQAHGLFRRQSRQQHELSQLPAELVKILDLRGARAAVLQVQPHRESIDERKLAVVEGRQLASNAPTGGFPHASLNSARKVSRARANRERTVPSATPSESPISS